MRKVLAALLTAAVFLFPLNATAAVKSGSVCSKLGATSTIAGKKYTCIKSGKKLVWNKGVAVAAPKPSETATTSEDISDVLEQVERVYFELVGENIIAQVSDRGEYLDTEVILH